MPGSYLVYEADLLVCSQNRPVLLGEENRVAGVIKRCHRIRCWKNKRNESFLTWCYLCMPEASIRVCPSVQKLKSSQCYLESLSRQFLNIK